MNIQKRLDRLEQGFLTLIQLHRLLSERCDALGREEKGEKASQQTGKRTEGGKNQQ